MEAWGEGGRMGKVPEYGWQSWGVPALRMVAGDQELKVILSHLSSRLAWAAWDPVVRERLGSWLSRCSNAELATDQSLAP